MAEHSIGRYQVKNKLGEGASAVVVRAHDPVFERDVAVKVLHRRLSQDATLRQRFLREVRTIAVLEHPTIVPIYDAGFDDGYLYLVTRLMEGGNLAGRIQQGSLSPREIEVIIERVGAALDAAHAKGMIHRDVKPENILFDRYGQVYLSDFGVVKLADSHNTLTTDQWIGTPAYMSPEQVRGQGTLDGRCDIYALGVVLFEMLTGELPYQADTAMSLAMKHVMEPVPRLKDRARVLPGAWQRVINKALAKRPGRRYTSGAALAADVKKVVARQNRRPAPGAGARGWTLPRGLPRTGLALMAAAIGIGAILLLGRGGNRNPPAAQAQVTNVPTQTAASSAITPEASGSATAESQGTRQAASPAATSQALTASAQQAATLAAAALATEQQATQAQEIDLTATAAAVCFTADGYRFTIDGGPLLEPPAGSVYTRSRIPSIFTATWHIRNTGQCDWHEIQLRSMDNLSSPLFYLERDGILTEALPVGARANLVLRFQATEAERGMDNVWRFLVNDPAGKDLDLANSSRLWLRASNWLVLADPTATVIPTPVPNTDRDGDGIANASDRCPDTPGRPEYNGCGDRDFDRVPDPDDGCPDLAGEITNNGCPGGGSTPAPNPTPEPPSQPTAPPINPTPPYP